MKKTLTGFILLLAFMLALPTNLAFAHSHQESTSPSEHEEVTEPVDEISVTFDAGIATGDIEVTNNTTNEEIEPASVEVESTVITAQFDEPLPNGEYIVYWENIGDDTHHVDGEFTFTVNVPEEELEEEGTAEEDATNEDATEEESTDNASEQETNVEDEQSETDNADSGSAVLWISIILAVLFIGGLIAFVVSRKKKK
ncbi:copper resistance protein CopC [Shouchella sp. 1P09AA]|uniref:copper resistance CopC family protein n=1 Tax=unclassified Shouchella TaxID=2893065 RepID=UPI00399FC2C2